LSIRLEHVSKTFENTPVLKDISLTVPSGQLVALLGPSGSGKTTLLRLIAGLESSDPGSGSIYFDGEDVAQRHAGRRGVGFVFQHYALFRTMSVAENIAFGLRVRPSSSRPGEAAIQQKVGELLRLVQLEGLQGRKPTQLSGGQRQRVALARALAVEPKVLLLDEPFGALDAQVRQELRRWLRRLHDEIHVTSVFVTHDQEEALEVADQVVVMNQGRIEQVAPPEELFHKPATAFVMGFLGNVNLFHGRVAGGKAILGALSLDISGQPAAHEGSAQLFVRPADFEVRSHPGQGAIPVVLRHVHAAGPVVRLELQDEAGGYIQAEIPHADWQGLTLAPGSQAWLTPKDARVFVDDYTI
jgi:sulfate transport system ATP-binding protein